MLEQKLIEDNHVMRNQNLELLDILKEAPKLLYKNFNFISFIFLTSLPLFCFMTYYEIFLQRTLVEAPNVLRWASLSEIVTEDLFHELVPLGFLCLVPLHLLELCTVIVTVDLASKIYAETAEDRPMTLKEMIHQLYRVRIRGTVIKSFYVLLLSTCILLGLIWLITIYYLIWRNTIFHVLFAVFNGVAFVALLTLYLEWSAVWNMSIVISVLEGIYGVEALALCAHFSKGSERGGLLLMLVFFVWGLGLRLPCLYIGCYGMGIVAQISLLCSGNVLKWVVWMLYFYDCKRRTLEKKVYEAIKAVDNNYKELVSCIHNLDLV